MHLQSLTLYSSNLAAQQSFYVEKLGCQLIEKTNTFFIIKFGASLLRFEYAKHSTIYHFALNIPHNQEQEAKKWLEGKTAILPFEGHEIVDFSDWNAKAIYFHDADKNIVELIGRKNIKNASSTTFSAASILEISEIGIATASVQNIYNQIKEQIAIDIYSGDLKRFCALGDEHGLFIIINKNTKKWIPTMITAPSSPFEITLIDKEKKSHTFRYHNDKITQ